MHNANIEAWRDEAQRLTQLELEILNELLSAKDLLLNTLSGEKQVLDTDKAEKQRDALKAESVKLSELDMVLAVVGTMKAGKSTTINAIVGTEVLPNRNMPSTTIPTLIRHTPEQHEPVLIFKNIAPIEELLTCISDALEKISTDDLQVLENGGLKTLIECIREGMRIETEYHGAQDIFKFLTDFNDIARLAEKCNIDFPFESYKDIQTLPRINVKFTHLLDAADSMGSLTLLDTPGPNEARNDPKLKKLMEEQFDKASAILLVANYTEMNSEADVEVRKQVQELVPIHKDRLYVLINKYDQKDRNSLGKVETAALFAKECMQGEIEQHRVFPVSAKNAYLANRAKNEISLHQQLPEQPWVEDFAKAVFGTFWQDQIKEADKVNAGAIALWKESGFEEPLEKVIASAHEKAASLAIQAASDRLSNCIDNIANFLEITNGLKLSIGKLKKEVEELDKDISSIEILEKEARSIGNRSIEDLDEKVNNQIKSLESEITQAMDKFFSEGKTISRNISEAARQQDRQRHEYHPIFSFLGQLFPLRNNKKKTEIWDPKEPVIDFGSDSENVRELVNNLAWSITEIYRIADSKMLSELDSALKSFAEQFSSEIARQAEDKIGGIQKRMRELLSHDRGDYEFQLTLRTPQVSNIEIPLDAKEMCSGFIKEEEKSVTHKCRKNGFFGWLGEKFNTNSDAFIFGDIGLGWETYTTTEKKYTVDMDNVKKLINKYTSKNISNFKKYLSIKVRGLVHPGIEKYFEEFRTIVEELRGSIQVVLNDKNRSQEEQNEIMRNLEEIKKKVKPVKLDIKELKNMLDASPF